jgi:hypothetical protein
MFTTIEPLREPLMAARLVREEIVAMPVRPDDRIGLRRGIAAVAGEAWAATLVAARLGASPDFTDVTVEALRAVADAAGGDGWRKAPGTPFHGQAAPPPDRVPRLLDEILETVNAPKAVEGWSPVLRAVAVHFLLRLVQPFEAPGELVGRAAEALVLASDGFDARHMRLPGPRAVGLAREGRPDPDAFALARVHALVEELGTTRDALRASVARAVLSGWAAERESGLNPRQRSVIEWLRDPGRSLDFGEYTGLHGGRAGPSLRSLQRDWRGLREAGWIVEGDDGRWRLSTAPLEWGPSVGGAAGLGGWGSSVVGIDHP